MRINYFVPRCSPDNSHGRYVIELAQRISQEHSVSIYSGGFWGGISSRIRLQRLPLLNRPAVARIASLWAASVVVSRPHIADVVHIQGADAPVGDVVTAHCCNPVMRQAAGRTATLYRRFNYSIGAIVEKYCMTKASVGKVIAVSARVKCEIEREYGVDPNKIVVIHHGVDSEIFHPRNRLLWRSRVRGKYGIGPQDFTVAFVGGDYRLKGLRPLLQAVARLGKRAKVLAIGVTPDDALRDFVKRNSLDVAVRFTGKTLELPGLYGAADCYVLPTRYDTFSMATLEAMSSALPVVVSKVAGIGEILTPETDSLVLDDADDPDVIAAVLRRLIDDESLRSTLGSAARATAERNTWDSVVRRTLSVYQATL